MVIEGLWQQYRPYADSNFLKEMRDGGLYPRFWEMFLTCALLKNGLPILERKDAPLSKKGKDHGPDVCICCSPKVWIEAVVPDTGSGVDRVPKDGFKEDFSVPDEEVKLRYLSVIRDKSLKRDRYIKDGVVDDSDPFVIAVNGLLLASVPDVSWSRIVRALFGLGDPYATIDRSTGSTIGGGYTVTEKLLDS